LVTVFVRASLSTVARLSQRSMILSLMEDGSVPDVRRRRHRLLVERCGARAVGGGDRGTSAGTSPGSTSLRNRCTKHRPRQFENIRSSRAQFVHSTVDICIVSALHPSTNPRVVKDADTLSAAGYSVALIAPDFSLWARDADKEFVDRPWKIVERPQFGPHAEAGVRIAERARRFVAGVAVRALRIEWPAVVRAAVHPIAPGLLRAAMRHPARLYLAHLVAALPAAAIAAEHHGALYAFDAEDFHPGDLPNTPEHATANRLIRLIEERYLPGCAYMTAAAPGIADAYAQAYGIRRPTVVLNAFPRSRAPSTFTPRGSVSPGPSIYWYSQTIGGDRGLQCAVRALAISRARPHLYLRGHPPAGIIEELEGIAAECGVTGHVHFLPMAPPNTMEALASAYDIGLCGETGHTHNRRIALTNKQFTYLLAGVPVLMSDIPAHRDFHRDARGATVLYSTDDPHSLAEAIDYTLASAETLAAMRKSAWQLGQSRFNAEMEAVHLRQVVDGVLRRSAVLATSL
jgi:glycosyltransferase involved in cell wall biosynthesis